jgi:hypothetical protein
MEIAGWKYYNHAAISTAAPHEEVDLAPISDGSIWNLDGSPILARWTSNFDCAEETNWWYVIKDNVFDIGALKAKRRYEINKGLKKFRAERIDPNDYVRELYEVSEASFAAYPSKYRPQNSFEIVKKSVETWISEGYLVYGAFAIETNKLCGYALIIKNGSELNYAVHKTVPACEKDGVNFALTYSILLDLEQNVAEGFYLCDGERSINHETEFQNWLEKYFGFRKAYCKLNLTYSSKIKWFVKALFPFRKILKLFDKIGICHKINSVLKMEAIVRNKE